MVKFYFKTLLPYFIMLFLNFYAVKYGFEGMTAPHDVTFMGGLLLLGAIVVVDVKFILWQYKKIFATQPATSKEETNNENTSA